MWEKIKMFNQLIIRVFERTSLIDYYNLKYEFPNQNEIFPNC